MEELDLKGLFNVFWNRKQFIILIVAIFVVLGFIYTSFMLKPQYESSTSLVLAKVNTSSSSQGTTDDSITQTELTLNQKLVSTYSELIRSKKVIRQVIENLGITLSEDSLRNSIKVSSVKDTELIRISVSSANPQYAAAVANEIAIVFMDEISEIYNINNVHVVDKAEVDNNPYNINHTKDIIMFTAIGVVIASLYAIIANMLDTTIKTQEDVEKHLNLTVLANIPIYEFEPKKGGKK